MCGRLICGCCCGSDGRQIKPTNDNHTPLRLKFHPPSTGPLIFNNNQTYNHSIESSQSQQDNKTMYRPLFLLSAIPQFIGTFGHSYLGERDIFPKLFKANTGVTQSNLRILRVTWHTASLSFALMGTILTVLGYKKGLLSEAERTVVGVISAWNVLAGIACLAYWDKKQPQGWMFCCISILLQLGLKWTP